jgi:hypothetical protein
VLLDPSSSQVPFESGVRGVPEATLPSGRSGRTLYPPKGRSRRIVGRVETSPRVRCGLACGVTTRGVARQSRRRYATICARTEVLRAPHLPRRRSPSRPWRGGGLLLGAKVPTAAISDPTLDSQGRFHGVYFTHFTLFGVLLLLCASDIPRYATVLRCVLWVFFAAGIARLVFIAIYGFPPAPVVALLVVEQVVPPALAWWLSRVGQSATS